MGGPIIFYTCHLRLKTILQLFSNHTSHCVILSYWLFCYSFRLNHCGAQNCLLDPSSSSFPNSYNHFPSNEGKVHCYFHTKVDPNLHPAACLMPPCFYSGHMTSTCWSTTFVEENNHSRTIINTFMQSLLTSHWQQIWLPEKRSTYSGGLW